MKTRLNIFCALILLCLSCSIMQVGYFFVAGFQAGYKSVPGEMEVEATRIANMKTVDMIPNLMDHAHLMQDSILNEKTGQYIPALYSLMAVSVKTETPIWQYGARTFLSFLLIGCYVGAIYFFIRLIVAVNKEEIFNWNNVHRLRKLGIMLILCYICNFGAGYLSYYDISQAFNSSLYSYNAIQAGQASTLVLGLVALLVAEIFAIGLRMKEEQDLTI